MKNKVLAELLRYSSPMSIWVVTSKNKLIELQCPFRVKCIKTVGYIKESEIYDVKYIKLATDFRIVFMVENHPYYYCYFEILIG